MTNPTTDPPASDAECDAQTARSRRLPWVGVIAVCGRESIDGRTLDMLIEQLPARLYEPGDEKSLARTVGSIDKAWQEGELVYAEGRIEHSYAGRTLTGGVDVLPIRVEVDPDDPAAHPIKVTGPLTGFALSIDPTWPEVAITVKEELTAPTSTVWMLVQEGEYHQWCPVSLHTTRESALAAVPTDAVHERGDPDPDMCEPEEWSVPWKPTDRLAGARLRIQEWEVKA